MSAHFIMVIAPMDQTVVGPFAGKEAAESYRKSITARFDRYVYTAEELAANFAEFGDLPVQAPILEA